MGQHGQRLNTRTCFSVSSDDKLVMGHSFLYARQNTGLLWHTAVRPSIHASYDNISHLFPLLLIGHVVTYLVLIKGGASERCDFSQFGKRLSYGIYN
jgi:hypothetical protein